MTKLSSYNVINYLLRPVLIQVINRKSVLAFVFSIIANLCILVSLISPMASVKHCAAYIVTVSNAK